MKFALQRSTRHGMTLLELLVVLIILAIVATVAVNSLQPRVETVRFEQTRSQIDQVQESVIGRRGDRQADGSIMVSGFVADVGRLPRPLSRNIDEDRNSSMLAELWDANSSLASNFPFQFRSGPTQPTDYSSVQLPCGYRGPYLQLPLGAKDILDSWGRPFEYELGANGTIECLSWQPVGEYNEQLVCGLKTGKVTVTGTINFGQSEPSEVEVVLLRPDPDSSLTELTVFADEDNVASTFTFTDVPVGLRAIVIQLGTRKVTRYIQVPHQGLSLAYDFSNDTPISTAEPSTD